MEFILRNSNPNHLLTILLLCSVLILTISKILYYYQFSEWAAVLQHSKYIALYAKNTSKVSFFNIFLYLFFAINTTIFLFLIQPFFNIQVQILTLFIAVNIYMLGMYLLKKICFEILGIGEEMHRILFQKTTLNHYLGLVFFILNLVLMYINTSPSYFFILCCVGFVVFSYVFSFVIVVAHNLKWVLQHWFYFILYLCTFKISPLLLGGFFIKQILI